MSEIDDWDNEKLQEDKGATYFVAKKKIGRKYKFRLHKIKRREGGGVRDGEVKG